MRSLFVRTIPLCCALALGGCLEMGPNLTGVSGTGSLSNPFVLPSENQTGLDQGIEDYLEHDGHWTFRYGSIDVLAAGPSLADFGDIIYDTRTDSWTVTVDGTDYTLSNSAGTYRNTACGGAGTCVELSVYDASLATSQYGTFGSITEDDGTSISVAQVYYGLKTPSADMPAGSATFNGTFAGQVSLAAGGIYDATSTTATIGANFDTGVVTLASSGTVADGGGGTYTLSGIATISGNVYSGDAVTGTYTSGGTILFSENGMLEGAFYGPAASETAGAVSTSSGAGDLLYGGFWGAR